MPEGGWTIEDILHAAELPDVAMRSEMARDYFDSRNAGGWCDRNEKPVARSRSALHSDMRRWKTNEPTVSAERISGNGKKSRAPSSSFEDLELQAAGLV